MATVLHPEALRHRDLHALDVVAVPHRLEHRVGEPQVQDLSEPHLPEEVVDPIKLRLVDVLMDLGRERSGGGEIVAERLLHDHPRGLGEPGLGQSLDHPPEQERRDLEVEDRDVRVADRVSHPLIRGRIVEIAAHIRQPRAKRSNTASSIFVPHPSIAARA